MRDKIILRLLLGCHRYWGIKDSRILFVLPFWEDRLDCIQLVGTFRHPLSVAKSLYFRNKIPLEIGLKIWERYNLQLYNLLKESEFPLISFDVTSEEYLLSIKQVIRNVGLGINKFNNNKSFYDNSLIHYKNLEDDEGFIPRDLVELYNKLNSLYKVQNNF